MEIQEPEYWKKMTPAQWERILFGMSLDEWCKFKSKQNVSHQPGTDVPTK